MALAWLQAHPDLKNEHDERLWLGDGTYSICMTAKGLEVFNGVELGRGQMLSRKRFT